jgi:hypothetical protein
MATAVASFVDDEQIALASGAESYPDVTLPQAAGAPPQTARLSPDIADHSKH